MSASEKPRTGSREKRACGTALLVTAVFFAGGCFYDVDGGVYDASSADGDSDSDSDADADAGDAGDTGIGTECSSDEDCADLEADLCAQDPSDPDAAGYCTIENCSPGECPASYQCCDCQGVAEIDSVFCATSEDAEMLESYTGCSCE